MTINIDHNFVRQFGDTFEQVANQYSSKLRMAVQEIRVRGKDFTIERLSNPNDTLPVVASRHADTSISDLDHSRRTGFLTSYARAYMIDEEDKVRMLLDPSSDYVGQMAGEFNRTIDDRIIEAALGDAASGETGGTTVALPAGQKIAHGSAALTLDKCKTAMKILMANNVDRDREDLYLAVNAEGYNDLVSDSGMTSIDNVDFKSAMDAKVPVVAGFKVIHAERLSDYTGTSAASTNRPAIAFAKSGLRLGMGMDKNIRVRDELLKNGNVVALIKTSFGATRAHDEKVVDIRFQE